MMHFHLSHIIPDSRLHGLWGYLEVIETLRWGLESLGHRVTTAVNSTAAGATNILFGFQVLDGPSLIDVLFYGLPSDRRLAVIRDLCLSGLRVVYDAGIFVLFWQMRCVGEALKVAALLLRGSGLGSCSR